MIVASFCNFKFTFKTLLLLASTLKKERKKKKTKSKKSQKVTNTINEAQKNVSYNGLLYMYLKTVSQSSKY